MKKVLHTQKLTQSRYLVLLASGYKKIFYMAPRVACWCLFRHWSTTNHVCNQPPCCDRSRCPSASNSSAVQLILSPSYQQPSYPPPLFSPTIASLTSLPDHNPILAYYPSFYNHHLLTSNLLILLHFFLLLYLPLSKFYSIHPHPQLAVIP